MKLSEYVAERVEKVFEEMAVSIGAGDVALEDSTDFTADDERSAVATMLMLDVLPKVMRVIRVALAGEDHGYLIARDLKGRLRVPGR